MMQRTGYRIKKEQKEISKRNYPNICKVLERNAQASNFLENEKTARQAFHLNVKEKDWKANKIVMLFI